MSELEESLKAVQETAKLSTQVIQISDKIFSFFASIIKEPLEECSGILTDKIKFFRLKRQIRIMEECKTLLNKRNIQHVKLIPIKFVLPIVENASLEDNDELQDLWVKLIVNGMDPESRVNLEYCYIEILKSLSPLDVRILEYIYKTIADDDFIEWEQFNRSGISKVQTIEALKITEEEYYLSIYNLFRVQCLVPIIIKKRVSKMEMNSPVSLFVSKNPDPLKGLKNKLEDVTDYKGAESVIMTLYGKKFVEACIK